MRTFVVTDIHGMIDKLHAVIEKSGIDKDNDRLICLGDTFDRGQNPIECMRELKTFKNLVYLMGNHDEWTLEWCEDTMDRYEETHWETQGARPTIREIMKHDAFGEVTEFLNEAIYYYELDGNLFVHAGFIPFVGIKGTCEYDLIWDRELIKNAKVYAKARANDDEIPPFVPEYKEVFLGHTPEVGGPTKFANVWAMDTGAAYGHVLTLMDVDSKKYWQA